MPNLKTALIQSRGWTEENCPRRFFLACLQPVHRPLATLLWPWRESLFDEDLRQLGRALECDRMSQVVIIAREFAHPHRDLRFWRDSVGVRPRGRRLLDLAGGIFLERE